MTASSKNTIGYLVNAFPSYSETFILNEIDELVRLGFSIRFFSLSRHADAVHDLAKKWVTCVHWPPLPVSIDLWFAHLHFAFAQPKKYFYALRNYSDYGGKRHFLIAVYFARIVEREEIRHIHAQFGWCAGAAMLIAFLTGGSFSFILHHADIFYVPPSNMVQLANRSSFCVTISQFNKRYLINQWPAVDPEKINVIHCGIDTIKFAPGARTSPDNKAVELLTVARLARIKNISFLIDLCECLQKRGLRYTCTIVGDGTERPNLERQIRELCLEDKVILKGVISQEKLVPIYQSADIFVLTSLSEGIPVTAMEAMSSGLPVVAPDITGMRELIEDGVTGFLFSSNDLSAAADAIARLMENPQLRLRMGACGQEKVIREYNVHSNAQKLASFFQSICQSENTMFARQPRCTLPS